MSFISFDHPRTLRHLRPSVRPITPSMLRHLAHEIRWSPPSISTPISSISAMSERSFYIVCPPERSVSFYTVKQMNMLLRLLTSVKSNICTYIVRSVRSFPVLIPHALTISPIRPRSPWHRRSICIIDYIIKYWFSIELSKSNITEPFPP